MSDQLVGLQPWLPWPLDRWQWLTQPVRAERLAALRIGIALVLLVDIATTYLPAIHDFFGGNSLGSPATVAYRFREPRWYWSVLYGVDDHAVIESCAYAWLAATSLFLLGAATPISGAATWVLSTSFATINPHIDNAGDVIRGIALFYLILTPCGAVWSFDACWRRWRAGHCPRSFVHPWALRLLFVQMCFIYCMNGLYKITGKEWTNGDSLYYVLGDLTLTRWSFAEFPMPYWLTKIMTWFVLGWEIGFPVLVILPWTRTVALLFGVAFHIGIGLSMELGGFVFYMLCLYLPLLPWERLAYRKSQAVLSEQRIRVLA